MERRRIRDEADARACLAAAKKAALWRFIDDLVVPIDNSPTEREFQNVAKLRLNA